MIDKVLRFVVKTLFYIFIALLLVYLFVQMKHVGYQIFADQAKDSPEVAKEMVLTVTEEESALLYSMADSMMQLSSIPCTACQYCMPCPYGLDIPGIFSHYNRCVNEGFVPESSKDPDYAKARRAFLIGYDRSVPRLRQADHCIGCWQCVHHCPQSINIPMQMQKIDKFVEDLKQGRAF